MNKDHLDDILVDLEVLYARLPPLARAHINEAQRELMTAANDKLVLSDEYRGYCVRIAAKNVELARRVLA